MHITGTLIALSPNPSAALERLDLLLQDLLCIASVYESSHSTTISGGGESTENLLFFFFYILLLLLIIIIMRMLCMGSDDPGII